MAASTSSSASSSSAAPAAFSEKEKPPPLDLTHLYAETTKLRLPSKMKEYYKFFQIPGVGNLAGGLPNVQYFPYDTLEAQIAKPERWTPRHASSSPPADRLAPAHLVVPKETDPVRSPAVTPDRKIDLATALQYGSSDGYPPLLSWIREFATKYLHPSVPYRDGPDVILTVGATDGLSKTFELFVNDWSPARDPVEQRPGLLCETFVYGNVLSQAQPKGLQIVPVAADGNGMVAYGPGGLEDVLEHWDPSKGLRPRLMYTVTMGHNPTGILLGLERRKELYAVCSRFDVVIVEDDPYWYLQFPSADEKEAESRSTEKQEVNENDETDTAETASSGFEFLDSLVPSFLRIDVDGRVVRLDTFSKTVAPGCRLGWITAQPALIERFTRIAETSTQQPSGFVQSLISELVMGPLPADKAVESTETTSTSTSRSLFRLPYRQSVSSTQNSNTNSTNNKTSFGGWQFEGWVRWLEGLRGEYERRMNTMCTILDEGSFQLKQGTPVKPSDADWGVITKTRLLSFSWPRGGMFIWVRILFESHPLWQADRPGSAEGAKFDGPTFSLAFMLFVCTKPYLVLFSPGTMFSATDEIRDRIGWAYIRICFAAESDANIEACSHRLVAGLQKFWKIKKAQDLEDLLASGPAIMADAAAADAAGEMAHMGTWMGC